jgi:hypothetical protein
MLPTFLMNRLNTNSLLPDAYQTPIPRKTNRIVAETRKNLSSLDHGTKQNKLSTYFHGKNTTFYSEGLQQTENPVCTYIILYAVLLQTKGR